MNMSKAVTRAVFLFSFLLSAGCTSGKNSEEKFTRLFCWGNPVNEEAAARYAEAGVTDIMVRNQTQYKLAKKYGMTPYWGCFLPVGPHKQVLNAVEQELFDYINGKDLDRKLDRSRRMEILHSRRREKQMRYGGDCVTEHSVLNDYNIACFSCDENLMLSKKALDKILQQSPDGSAGMFMDFIGYTNNDGCYCKKCLEKYKVFLFRNKLDDTKKNKTAFYRREMVNYCNQVIDHVKSKRPDYKIVVHVHPMFRNDPLYGNRTKADYCGQTVSWYFPWDQKTIKKKTEFVVEHARDHYPHVEGVPFIGINPQKGSSLAYKAPDIVEQELKIILSAGGRNLLVCNGSAILKDGYFEVFKKYFGHNKKHSGKGSF